MHLGILVLSKTKNGELTSLSRLVEEGVAQGHSVEMIFENDLAVTKTGDKIVIHHPLFDLSTFDGFLVKAAFSEEPSLHTPTLEALERTGYRLVNPLPHGTLAKNKLSERIVLHDAGIAMPAWAIARTNEQAETAAQAIGFPLIVKVGYGTHGKGVLFAPNLETFRPIADYLLIRDKNPIVLERFIAEADCKDLRLFVINGRVIAAMERRATKNDVRANASLGGTGFSVETTPEERAIAVKAAAVFNLAIAGVDLIRSHAGPLVLEVNANPGFEELERASGVNVAGAIIAFANEQLAPHD